MSRVVAFTGLQGSGKSEAVRYLATKYSDHAIIKFAQPLYDIQEFAYRRIYKDNKIKDRKLLQFLGTEWGRAMDENLWVDIWELEMKHMKFFFKRDALILTDDLRFDNEALMVAKYKGAVVHVVSDRVERAKRIDLSGETHSSESGISPSLVTATIYNNEGLEEFHKRLDHLMEQLNVSNKSHN